MSRKTKRENKGVQIKLICFGWNKLRNTPDLWILLNHLAIASNITYFSLNQYKDLGQSNKWGKIKMRKDITVFLLSQNQVLSHSCHCTIETGVVISFQTPLLQTQKISTTPITGRAFTEMELTSTSELSLERCLKDSLLWPKVYFFH